MVPSMTQYSKICSSSVPLQGFQGTLCVFHDLVNPRNLLPELPSWQENLPSTFAALHPSIPSTIQIGKLLSLFEKPRISFVARASQSCTRSIGFAILGQPASITGRGFRLGALRKALKFHHLAEETDTESWSKQQHGKCWASNASMTMKILRH